MMIIHLEWCLCPPDLSPVFPLFLLYFWSPPPPERNMQYVHQLVSVSAVGSGQWLKLLSKQINNELELSIKLSKHQFN